MYRSHCAVSLSLLLRQLETGLTVKLHAGASTHHVDYMQTETLWMLLKCKVAKNKQTKKNKTSLELQVSTGTKE